MQSSIAQQAADRPHRAPRSPASLHRGVARAGLLAVGLLLTGTAAAGRVTCESSDRQYQFCRTDTRGGVELDTQLSHADCRKNTTWGYNDGGIWVSNGCRAMFHTGTHRSSRHDDKDSDKAAAVLAGAALVAIGAMAAHAKHEEHHSNRHDDYYRYQEPEQAYDRYRNDRYSRTQRVNCDSSRDRYNYCEARIRNAHVRILRKHSKSSCTYNSDWGYDRHGIWVDNGCRATFEIES